MITLRNLLLAGMVPLFCSSIGNAQIIYSNAFNGGAVNIHGTVPTVANDFAGGTSAALWNSVSNSATSYIYADGTVGTSLNSVLLPFTPESGYVYTLTASVTVPTMTAGKWITMGFSAYNPASNTASDPRFGSTYVNGNPWTYLTEGSGGCVFWPIRTVNEGGNPNLMPTPGTYTVQLKLDTTGANWIASEFVDGTQMGTNYTYSSNPTISAVGIGQTTLNSSAGINWNYLTFEAVGTGPTANTVIATVNFLPTNMGLPLNPAFIGLSYEKLGVTTGFFSSNNVPLVKLFSLIGPAVLRMGGGTVDSTCWGGLSNLTPITASEVDTFAGFMKALPTNWSVIYGINFVVNNPTNCAAEAAYAAKALGPRLLGFELGNEPEGYNSGVYRPTNFLYSDFLPEWRPLAAAITNTVPGWAITNGGNGWTLTGPSAGQGSWNWTVSLAGDEKGIISMTTQHYYRAAGGSPNDTMQLLLQPDPYLLKILNNIVPAATAANLSLGTRIDECASYSAGGVVGVSDAYGASLWSLDYMFTLALNGCQGFNFHGGGRSPYTPILDNGTTVQAARPEFYGLKMFSLLPRGNVIPASVSLASSINFTAYGVRCTSGGISALLNNKDTTNAVATSVNLGPGITGAQLIELTGPTLNSTSGYTLGGAPINPDGSWAGGVQAVLPATNGQLTVVVPPISAFLLNPVISPTNITVSVAANQLTLSWPANYTGWLLQSNSTGLTTTNWSPVSGSGNTNRVQITIQPGQGNVFYRLALP
jgi:hypothetical protein